MLSCLRSSRLDPPEGASRQRQTGGERTTRPIQLAAWWKLVRRSADIPSAECLSPAPDPLCSGDGLPTARPRRGSSLQASGRLSGSAQRGRFQPEADVAAPVRLLGLLTPARYSAYLTCR